MGDLKSKEKMWIEVVIDVPEAFSDAVSNFLISTLGRGVLVEDRPEGEAAGGYGERIKAYLSQKDLDEGILHSIEIYLQDLRDLHSDFPEVHLDTRVVREEDWSENWKKYFKPQRIGRRFVVKPSWENYVPDMGDMVLEIDPGQAFGTGTHPSTGLVLEAMERLWTGAGWLGCDGEPARPRDNDHVTCPEVLDVGTGTGILGIAAAKLGAASVVCLDVDPVAEEVARANALRNHVHRQMTVSSTPLWQVEEAFDVILANLDRETLLLLAEDLVRRLRPRGVLIVSGILASQRETVASAFESRGLRLAEAASGVQDDEWVSLVLKRRRS